MPCRLVRTPEFIADQSLRSKDQQFRDRQMLAEPLLLQLVGLSFQKKGSAVCQFVLKIARCDAFGVSLRRDRRKRAIVQKIADLQLIFGQGKRLNVAFPC